MSKTKQKPKDKSRKNERPDGPDFPGYPPYPEREDITLQNKRVSMNDEGVAVNPKDAAFTESTPQQRAEEIGANYSEADELDGGNESDVTREDLEALGPKDLSLDMGDDEELLKHRTRPVDFGAQDLDVPGAELDDPNEAIGHEDEENNPYSLGSEQNENLEQGEDPRG